MNLKRLVAGALNLNAMSLQLLASSSGTQEAANVPCVIVFGRPGAGKTTVADTAVGLMRADTDICCLGLDLDVCVPDWMRENFAKGIYPTLKQREIFATDCCDYVEKKIHEMREKEQVNPAAIVSFSFVNTDLRDIFRSRFPHAKWVLIDTSENEATKRISMRNGHFYQGEKTSNIDKDKDKPHSYSADNAADNSAWKFAPVTFDHVLLDGTRPIETNADRVVQLLHEAIGPLD